MATGAKKLLGAGIAAAAVGAALGWYALSDRGPARAPPLDPPPWREKRPAAKVEVRLSTDPQGATIWVDGQSTERVTPDILFLDEGVRRVRLELESHRSKELEMDLRPGQVREEQVVLSPERI